MPAITCSSVVLPQPLRPTSTICSPSCTSNRGISKIGSLLPSGSAYDFFTFRSCSIWASEGRQPPDDVVSAHTSISPQRERGKSGLRSEEHTSELQSRENLVCR